MNFYAALDTDSSRAVGELVANAVGNNPEYFKTVLGLAMRDIPKVSLRAGRVIFLCCEKYPELLDPYIEELIISLSKLKNEGAIRTILKALTLYDEYGNENSLGMLMETCFNFLSSNEAAVAVKIYSMDILFNICKKEPGLKYELMAVIEDQIPKNSKAFKARAKSILKRMNQQFSAGNI